MMRKIASLRYNRSRENGSAEVVTTLFMLPIAFFLILTLIEMGMYFNTRSLVQNVVQDATRQAAAWGGNNTRLVPQNYGTGGNVASAAAVSITHSTAGSQVKNLVVQCTPGQASEPGTEIRCTASYNYRGVTGGAANFLGFTFINKQVVVNGVSRSSVGFR